MFFEKNLSLIIAVRFIICNLMILRTFCTLVDGPMSTSLSGISEEANMITDVETPEEGPEATDSSSSSYKDLISTKFHKGENLFSISPMNPGTNLSLFF